MHNDGDGGRRWGDTLVHAAPLLVDTGLVGGAVPGIDPFLGSGSAPLLLGQADAPTAEDSASGLLQSEVASHEDFSFSQLRLSR